MIKIGSLFSGIGGFELGLERAIPGSKTIWQVEQDAFCQKVLQKHWPDAKIYDDVVGVGSHNLEPVDVLCGGFPCQGISNAGKKEGLKDERSGLWWEMLRVISELQPRVVVLENVAALFIRGIPEVLGSLAENGYDAEWTIVSAAECGAPHRRDRVFIVAYPVCIGRVERKRLEEKIQPSQFARLQREESQQPIVSKSIHSGNKATTNTKKTYWRMPGPQPTIRRTHDGFPNRVDQLRALGNAIVPQCSEWVGRRIMESGLLCD
jgi:DNA (cytosine-5)-methyltransferase 1